MADVLPAVVVFLAVGLVLLALAVLTGVGARRRGAGWPRAVLSGLFFPVTWMVWYERDRRSARVVSSVG